MLLRKVEMIISEEVRSVLPRLTAELETGISDGLHLGGQIYISHSGTIVADFAFGVSQPDVPVTTDMLFPWMSASKPLAAISIAQLMERSLIDLDQPVARYIPEFAVNGKSAITIRHLLTHTCGIRGHGREIPGTPWDEILSRICQMPIEPNWIPGQRAGYHIASSWFVLGELVRRLDGRTYSQYIRDQICIPLGMDDTWVGMPLQKFSQYGSRIGWMYLTERGARSVHEWHTAQICHWCSPGGGGRGPARDLGRFYEMLLNGGEGPRGTVLSAPLVALFTRRHRVGLLDETFQHKMDWGLGFIVNSNHYGDRTVPYSFGTLCSPETFGHGGFQSSCGYADPACQLVVAVILNGTPGEARHSKRIRMINTAIYEDLDLQVSA